MLAPCPHCRKLNRIAYHAAAPCPNAPKEVSVAWREPVAASAQREAVEREQERRVKASETNASTDRWAKVREEAKALGGPGLFGYLMWVERNCVDVGKLHKMDPQWVWHFEEFYASGKMIDLGRGGLRAAKSDSVVRAITAEVLLLERILEPTVDGVCPILSSKISEANDRVKGVRATLRACGFQDLTGSRVATVEAWQFRVTGGGNQPLVIELLDSQGHEVEFRIFPANEAGAAGFTGIAGFADELDLWGKAGGANPAAKVVEILKTRYTTQPEAKLHMWSATYDRQSYHAEQIDKGDTMLQRVARLGINGAMKDYADRIRLAKSINSSDPDLLAPGDPDSVNIPSWVSNPVAPIEYCYTKCEGDLRRMFALYGARPQFAGSKATTSAEDMLHMARRNRECFGGPPSPGTLWPNGLIPVPGYDYTGGKTDPGGYRGL